MRPRSWAEGALAVDAVALALDLGLRVELDLKSHGLDPAVGRVAELLDGLDAHARTWVTTFHPIAAWRLRHADRRLVVGWSIARSRVERLPLWTGWAMWLGVQVLAPHHGLLDAARLTHWRSLGLTVETWGLATEDAQTWLDQDVSVVIDALDR